jgi:hypothetical protein
VPAASAVVAAAGPHPVPTPSCTAQGSTGCTQQQTAAHSTSVPC